MSVVACILATACLRIGNKSDSLIDKYITHLKTRRKRLCSIVPFVLYSYILGCDIILAYQRTPIYLKHSLFAVMNVIRNKEKL